VDQWADSTSLIFDRQVFLVTGLGDRLKEARTDKGYTLDDLQAITKIQKRYLAGIENEEFGSMPGSFYVRAFIKQYAEAVELDADEMLSLYRESSGSIEPSENTQQPPVSPNLSRRGGSRSNSQLTEMMPKIIAALFIIVIFGAMWFLYQHNASKVSDLKVDGNDPITVQDQQSPEDDKDVEKVEEKAEPEEEPEEEPATIEQALDHVNIVGEDSTYSLSSSDKFQLEIKTTGDSWIGVLDSERTERTEGARVMKAGETTEVLDVSDTGQVRIRVGRPAATEIYVNDELLEYASDSIPQNIIIEYEKE